MSGKKTIWAVSSGSYSDYRVLFLCDSEELAESAAKSLYADPESWHSDARVEEMELYSRLPERVPYITFLAEIRDVGGVVSERSIPTIEHEGASYEPLIPCQWRWVRAPVHHGLGGRLEVSGTDHELCRKVYGEKRALLVADAVFRAQVEVKGRVLK